MKDIGTWLLNIGTTYPDLLSTVVGTFGGWCASLLFDWRYPPEWNQRTGKNVALGLSLIGSTVASAEMWALLDPTDGARLRWTVSAILSLIAAVLYPLLAAWLTSKYPVIGSVFAKAPK